jgi:hypothetical protein
MRCIVCDELSLAERDEEEEEEEEQQMKIDYEWRETNKQEKKEDT